jgi:hypothetical protein
MSQPRNQFTTALLLGAHILAGATLAFIGSLSDGWTEWQSIGFIGLIGSEMLLLGMWAGFSARPWWLRLVGLSAGIVWITGLVILPDPDSIFDWNLFSLVSVTATAVAVSCGFFRVFAEKLEQSGQWAVKSVSEDLQFSIKTLVILTISISLILALGRFFRWLGDGSQSFMLFILIVVFISLLAVVSALWSCLGSGQLIVRVPLMLMTMAGLGLLPPYYAEMDQEYFLLWSALLIVIALYCAGSLLVVRSCGYRLVRRQRRLADNLPNTNEAQTSPGMEVAG